MAGEPLSLTELKEWYTALNTVITNYSGGTISTLTAPADAAKVLPTDINNAYDRIQAMKDDEFLGTQNFYSTFTKVAQGEIVERADAAPIVETTKKITAIKCRNTTTYTNQYHSHTEKNNTAMENGTQSHGNQTNGSNSQGTHGNQNNANGQYYNSSKSNGWKNNSLCYWGTQGNGVWNNGQDQNGANSHTLNSHLTNSHLAKSNEGYKDILNVHTTENKN